MFYIVYKITNKLDGRFYIGKHQTKDLNDRYMGSGNLIKRAIKKYGIENFNKEILHVFDNEEEMNLKEKELVVIGENSYNLCKGGKGGFGYINQNRDFKKHNLKISKIRDYSSDDYRKKLSKSLKGKPKDYLKGKIFYDWTGQNHTNETKLKISESNKINQSGCKNSQYGTMWITNGNTNKKIKKIENIPEGWYKGRIT